MKKLKEIKTCNKCNLCLNQPPLLDNRRKAQVFWVGLSAVKVSNTDKEIPLSSNTNSGKLIDCVEKNNKEYSFYKTNLVKCLPLENNKIRYPKNIEMELCFHNLQIEIKSSKPKVVFLLGKMVSDFVMRFENIIFPKLDDNFKYQYLAYNNIYYVPIHHPSYILIYKRKFIEKYLNNISELLTALPVLN